MCGRPYINPTPSFRLRNIIRVVHTTAVHTHTHSRGFLRKPGASNRRTDPEPKGGASLCRLGFGGGDLGRDNLSGTENSKGARCEDVERGTSIPLVCTGEVPLEREGTVNRAPSEVRNRGRTDGNLRLRPAGPVPIIMRSWPREDSTHDPCPGPLFSHSCPPPSRAPLGQPEWQLERP